MSQEKLRLREPYCTCENYIFIIVIAGAFLIVQSCVQKNPQPGWQRISADRTFLFLRQRIFRGNIFSIPAVLEMGVEGFRKSDILPYKITFLLPVSHTTDTSIKLPLHIEYRWSTAFLQLKFVSVVWQATQ